MIFYLGTHHPNWLATSEVPLFVSRRTLGKVKKLPRASADWALDSGGFSELNLFGAWTTSPSVYVREVRRFASEVGRLQWAAAQDWMCEPFVLKKTGKSVAEHQTLTIDNYLELMTAAPELPWTPVIQGYSPSEYLRHVESYTLRGVDLASLNVVGVGSVCRRQGSEEIRTVFQELRGCGLKLHGFGVKSRGLAGVCDYLTSADSLAWSFTARKQQILMDGCSNHKNCANCKRYALKWRGDLLAALPRR